jgi:hypothetical protein
VLTSGPSLAKLVAAPLLTLLIVHQGWRTAFSPLTSGFLFGLPSVVGMGLMLAAGWLTDRLLAAGVPARVARGLCSWRWVCYSRSEA